MKNKQTEIATSGVTIDPLAVYTSADCCQILGCVRSTLTRYMEEQGFPLKPIGSGRALGKDILDWITARPSKKQRRGPTKRKPSTRKLAAAK